MTGVSVDEQRAFYHGEYFLSTKYNTLNISDRHGREEGVSNQTSNFTCLSEEITLLVFALLNFN